MKKTLLATTALLGATLLLGSEAMAWHFETSVNNGAWEAAGQTLSFSSLSTSTTDFEQEITNIVTNVDAYSGITTYEIHTDIINASQSSGPNVFLQPANYRVVADDGSVVDPTSDIDINWSFTSSANGEITHNSSSNQVMDLVTEGLLLTKDASSGEVTTTYEVYAPFDLNDPLPMNDIYFYQELGQYGPFGNFVDSYSNTNTVQAMEEHSVYGFTSASTSTFTDNYWGIWSHYLGFTEQELIDAGLVDSNGNVDPFMLLGETIVSEAFASSSFNLTLTIADSSPSSVPEPGSMLVYGSGLLGMIGFRIRNKKPSPEGPVFQ